MHDARFIYSEESASILHVNLSVVVCVETRFNKRPDNRSTPNNRYGLPTSGNDSEALLQLQFDQYLPPRLIRTFTAGHKSVKAIFATEHAAKGLLSNSLRLWKGFRAAAIIVAAFARSVLDRRFTSEPRASH